MAYEQRDMSGSLFPNQKKQQENHADYNGTVMVDGKEYWLNGWRKETSNGTKWMSLALKLKEPRSGQSNDAPSNVDMDDEIPF